MDSVTVHKVGSLPAPTEIFQAATQGAIAKVCLALMASSLRFEQCIDTTVL